ncbi:MAG: P-loop NTPase, partial [Mariprofundaceae bacterium]
MVREQDIKHALSGIIDPDLGKDIVSLGFVKDIEIDGGRVSLTIELTTPACPVKEDFRRRAEEAVMALPGVKAAEVRMTSRVRGAPAGKRTIPGIAHIIAVASGKGGVGKSTVAANLAAALALSGARTGLLDADIHGPSIPRMMGLEGRRPRAQGKRIEPLINHGVRTMSIGYLIEQDQATIWRGPMASGAMMQLLTEVEWGELDYLVLD